MKEIKTCSLNCIEDAHEVNVIVIEGTEVLYSYPCKKSEQTFFFEKKQK